MNRALRALLTPLLPTGCEVRFGPPGAGPGAAHPTDEAVSPAGRAAGHPTQSGAGLLWFLTDVREDEKAAETDWEDLRDDSGRVVARRPPVRRFDLCYLVAPDTTDPATEGALLDAVLIAVDPGRRLPAELLDDSFAGRPVVLRLGERAYPVMPDRTTLTVVVNAPLVRPPVTEVAPPAEDIRLGVAGPDRPVPRPAAPRRPGPGRWRGAAVDEDADD